MNSAIHGVVAIGVVGATFCVKSSPYSKVSAVAGSALYLISLYSQKLSTLRSIGITIISMLALRDNFKLSAIVGAFVGVCQVALYHLQPAKIEPIDSEILELDTVLDHITEYVELDKKEEGTRSEELITKHGGLFLGQSDGAKVLRSPMLCGKEIAIELSVTEANPNYKYSRYLDLMCQLKEKVIEKYPDKDQRINYVSLGSGNMLFDWYCIALLIKEGYKNISISLIDTAYDCNEKSDEVAQLKPEAIVKHNQFISTLKRYALVKKANVQSRLLMSLGQYTSDIFPAEKINVFTGVNFSWTNVRIPGQLNKDVRKLSDLLIDSSVGLFASSSSVYRHLGYRSMCTPHQDQEAAITTTQGFLKRLAPEVSVPLV
ncbi:MAG: hypothetical protein P0S95_02225 [Rhabdochlamydiaceae bacterium]|nr:hypothetical protein [Candidatus Amphrikana amoebophyrae]